MSSSSIVVQAPMSFTGSAKRLRKLPAGLGLLLIPVAWTLVLAWYCVFGLLLVPYRMIRRGSRNRQLADARHQELVNAR